MDNKEYVYVVMKGYYSDKHVVAVFTEKNKKQHDIYVATHQTCYSEKFQADAIHMETDRSVDVNYGYEVKVERMSSESDNPWSYEIVHVTPTFAHTRPPRKAYGCVPDPACSRERYVGISNSDDEDRIIAAVKAIHESTFADAADDWM